MLNIKRKRKSGKILKLFEFDLDNQKQRLERRTLLKPLLDPKETDELISTFEGSSKLLYKNSTPSSNARSDVDSKQITARMHSRTQNNVYILRGQEPRNFFDIRSSVSST